MQRVDQGLVALVNVRCEQDARLAVDQRGGIEQHHGDGFGQLVLVTHNECIGCKACLASCPYDARFVHPQGYADKCTFCVHRVKEGLDPSCVSVCPTHCFTFGDLDDPDSAISRKLASRRAHPLLPAAGTRPRIFYLD